MPNTKVLKNAQVSKLYGVSRPTVGKWLEAAETKELNLELEEINNRMYIIDTQHNRAQLQMLKEKGAKYKNKIGYEKVSPDLAFYEIFSFSQIVDIIGNLEYKKFIPMKYAYFDQGAELYNKFIVNVVEKREFYLDELNQLISSSLDYLVLKTNSYEEVDIIDTGTGNGYTVKPVIERLLKEGKVVKYKGYDLSQKMLDILSDNITTWFPEIDSEFIIADFEEGLLREELFINQVINPKSCNLILLLGSTIGNVPDRKRVFDNFSRSMGRNDFLIFDNGLDTPTGRINFGSFDLPMVIKWLSWIPDFIGIHENSYELINRYDEQTKSRKQIMVLKKDLDIEFRLNQGVKTVRLTEGDEIVRCIHHPYTLDSLIHELKESQLRIDHLASYPTNSRLLVICEAN